MIKRILLTGLAVGLLPAIAVAQPDPARILKGHLLGDPASATLNMTSKEVHVSWHGQVWTGVASSNYVGQPYLRFDLAPKLELVGAAGRLATLGSQEAKPVDSKAKIQLILRTSSSLLAGIFVVDGRQSGRVDEPNPQSLRQQAEEIWQATSRWLRNEKPENRPLGEEAAGSVEATRKASRVAASDREFEQALRAYGAAREAERGAGLEPLRLEEAQLASDFSKLNANVDTFADGELDAALGRLVSDYSVRVWNIRDGLWAGVGVGGSSGGSAKKGSRLRSYTAQLDDLKRFAVNRPTARQRALASAAHSKVSEDLRFETALYRNGDQDKLAALVLKGDTPE